VPTDRHARRQAKPVRRLARLTVAVMAAVALTPTALVGTSSAATAPPNTDIYRSQEWTLGALHITKTWKYAKGDGVVVAVLDTGVDGQQADLAGRVIDGPDYTGYTRKPGNKYWGRHGTAMASIIAGHGHGPGAAEGVIGVAPDARILSIRVTLEDKDPNRDLKSQLDRDRGAIASGIRYAVDHGAQIINMSLGGGKQFYDGNPTEEKAIEYALSRGVVLIASAGNDGNAANQRNYPAAYPGVIAVGSVERNFKPSDFTNRHDYVSVAAPGRNIVSADTSGRPYVTGTGTSVSSAFVAGIAALLKSRYPELTPEEVRQALEQGSTHKPAGGRSLQIGAGVVDAYSAFRVATQINQADHGGAATSAPSPMAAATLPPPAHHHPDLMLIAILTGGGTLIALSLVMGWRERRRAFEQSAHEEDQEVVSTPSPPPAITGRNRPSAIAAPTYTAPIHPAPVHTAPVEVAPWQSMEAFSLPLPEPSSLPTPNGHTNGHVNGHGGFPSHTEEFRVETDDGARGFEKPPAAPPAPRTPPAQRTPPADPAPPAPPANPARPVERTRPPVANPLSDPLGFDPADDEGEVGTPLADQSWDRIRRSLDRVKADFLDDTENLPAVAPDEDTE
jgi:type VII secretion-associated serine protease mycosin